MRLDNPAVYECPKNKKTLHAWKRNADQTATCQNCGVGLNKRDADDAFTSYENFMKKAEEGL